MPCYNSRSLIASHRAAQQGSAAMHSEFVSSVTYKGYVIAIDRFGDAWMFSTEPPDHVVTVRKLLVGAGSMRVAMRAFDQWQA